MVMLDVPSQGSTSEICLHSNNQEYFSSYMLHARVCCTLFALRFSGHLHSILRRCDNVRTIPSKHFTTLPELLLAATRSHYIIFMSQRLEHEIFFECEGATF